MTAHASAVIIDKPTLQTPGCGPFTLTQVWSHRRGGRHGGRRLDPGPAMLGFIEVSVIITDRWASARP